MFNLIELKCKNYQEFYDKLQGLNQSLENANVEKETLSKISEFIESNKDIFRKKTAVVILFDSIGLKVHQMDAKDPLINNLKTHIRQLLPSDPDNVKVSLQFFRSTIPDNCERIQSIADWTSLMGIPLASLDLSEEELAGLLTRLGYVDLTNYNFETHDLGYLTRLLLSDNLRFKTKDVSVLRAIALLCAKENARGTAYLFKNFGIEDSAVRTEIALFCAKKDPVATALHFKKFKIVDPGDRAVIANICAQQANIAEFFKHFGIKEPIVRLDIARLCAQRAGIDTALYIKNFELDDEDERADIAHLCVKQCSYVIKLIHNFKILNPVVRTKIALQWAEIHPKETAEYIANFNIEDPVSLEKIARLCAMQIGGAEFIKNFAISDPLVLKELAHLCAKQDGRCTAQYIEDFGIMDQAALAEIGKLCANQNGSIAEFINNFGIADPLVLEEIACICAKKNPWATTLNFKNFGFVDPNIRAKIAFICAENSESHTAEYIGNFEIENPTVIEGIVRLCAKKNGSDTAEFIKNFKITSHDFLIEIARLCAKNNGAGTATHIKNFEIKDLNIRAEIACLCAQQNGGGTAFNIEKFDIDDIATRVMIARLCAQQSGGNTAEFIKNFEIADPAIRAEIACLCAKQSGVGTAGSIKNFELDDPAMRFKIACLCAQQSGMMAGYISNFEIKELTARIEIARLCAMQDSRSTAQFFRQFEITNQGIRVEIARLCALNSGFGTAQYIKKFELSNSEELEVFYQCFLSDPESLFFMNNSLSLHEEFTKLFIQIQKLKLIEKLEISDLHELFNEIDQLILKSSFPENCQETLIKTSKEVRSLPPHAQNVIGLWLVASLIAMKSLKDHSVKWMIDSGLWRELALLRDPQLRVLLSGGLYDLSADEVHRKLWEGFFHSVRGVEGKKGLMLLAIPFFALQKNGVPQEKLMERATSMAVNQKENTSSFRSVYHIKNMLHTMQTLASNNVYNSEMKKAGFEKIFNSGEEVIIIKNIIAAKGLIQLKDPDWPTSSEDLSVLFRNSLEKVIPLEGCKVDVSQKYEEIFGSCSDPGGLLTYAAGLKTLQEPEVMTCLGKYVTSVLEGTFKEMRYKTEGNPHLAKIMEFNPTLLDTWKEDLSFDFETLTSESTPIVFNPEDWLKMTLITQQHLGDIELTFVKRYLDDDSNKEGVFRELVEQINLTRKEKEKTQLRKDIKESHVELERAKLKKALNNLNEQVSADPNLAKLNLEKACLNLIQKGQGAEKNILINLLEQIDKALMQEAISSTTLSSVFAKDVKDLIDSFKEELKRKERSKEGLKVLFTDDPIDLLLCGIGESCQRLDGDVQLNKGLLGYLLDGKNRIIVIKEGDKMIARCILRLLWDGEQPVLFREIFYPKTLPVNHQVALNNLAKRVAKKLSLPLTSKDGDILYGKDLEALGGPAPYEYSDGAGAGVQKEGRYKIIGSKQMVSLAAQSEVNEANGGLG